MINDRNEKDGTIVFFLHGIFVVSTIQFALLSIREVQTIVYEWAVKVNPWLCDLDEI